MTRGSTKHSNERALRAYLLGSLTFFILLTSVNDCLPGKSTATSYAQTSETEELALRKELLEERYENDVKRILERFVPSQEFYIDADVTPVKAGGDNIPYLPYGLNTRIIQTLPLSKLKTHVTKLSLTIYLSERFNAQAQERIRKMVEAELGLDLTKGDSLSFSPLNLPYQKPDTQWDRELSKLESDRNQILIEAKILERERNDIKQQLTVMQAALEQERQKTQEKVVENQQSGTTTDSGKGEVSVEGQETSWTVIAGIVVAGLIMIALAFLLAGKLMGGAVSKVANALESVGSSIESGAKTTAVGNSNTASGGSVGSSSSAGSSTQIPEKQVGAPAGLPPVPRAPMADTNKIVAQLHEELKKALTPDSESFLLMHVSSMLSNPETREIAVATLEIFGKDLANQLFTKLNRTDQEEILRHMRQGVYSKSKDEVLIDAGELVKTKILAGMLRRFNGDLDASIGAKLASLDDERLIVVVTRLHQGVLPRLLIYLEPARIAVIFEKLSKKNPKAFANVAASLTDIPAAFENKQLDLDLAPAIEEAVAQIRATDQRPYLRFYLDVVESAGVEIGEEIVNIIPKGKQEVRDYLEGNFITYSTLFKLTAEVQEEVIAKLTNLEIANFMLELGEVEKEVIQKTLDEKRYALIIDELSRYDDLTKRQKDSATRFARNQVIKRIKEIKGNTRLEDLLKQPDNDRAEPEAA